MKGQTIEEIEEELRERGELFDPNFNLLEPKLVKRKCNRCDKVFVAKGKHIHTCEDCKMYLRETGAIEGDSW